METLLREYVSQARAAVDAMRAALQDTDQGSAGSDAIRDSGPHFKTIELSAGFLGLSRLAALAHAVRAAAPSIRLPDEGAAALGNVLDRMSEILDHLEQEPSEPTGDDEPLLSRLRHLAQVASIKREASGAKAEAGKGHEGERQLRILKAAWRAVDQPTRAAFVEWLQHSGDPSDTAKEDSPRATAKHGAA